jgi:MerR family transcriptional regulator/heat shock protein HspR
MQQYDLVACPNQHQQLTLEVLAVRAGTHPALVERFMEFGLLQPIGGEDTILFDPSDVRRLGVINRLRAELGINLPGVAVVLDLLERLRILERENQSLRHRPT